MKELVEAKVLLTFRTCSYQLPRSLLMKQQSREQHR
jgi:hypothetical protein